MDLLDLAILALRVAIVAVLYGFMVVVLRSARRSLRAARPAPSNESPKRVELQLVVLVGGGSGLAAGQLVDVGDGRTFGRSERAEVVLADATVSAEHARVSRAGSAWVVRDLGSTNGTLVNGSRVNGQTTLHHGDLLAFGGVQFKVGLRAASRDGGER